MAFLNYLIDENKWKEFIETKVSSKYIPKKEAKEFVSFFESKKYLSICNNIINNTYNFSIPKKIVINKVGKSKKRIVYSFSYDETIILKYINYLLYEYDYLFSPNLYSFRKKRCVSNAIHKIQSIHSENKFAYKVDISNYFNSINIDKLLDSLKNDLESGLYNLLFNILKNEYVLFNNKAIKEKKGVMAGMPLSGFLANYYLMKMDKYFYNRKIDYFRYADDIIVFGNTYEEVMEYKNIIINTLKDNELSVNPDKEFIFYPSDSIEFLGFSINGIEIDLSKIQVKKIKDKIRRSAKSIRRWKIQNKVDDIAALVTMNKKYNNKFYGKGGNELSWKYWFFSLITTSKSLHEIDLYMQDWQRYIITGVHNKKNYDKVSYSFLKKCKYKPLVHEYYNFSNDPLED